MTSVANPLMREAAERLPGLLEDSKRARERLSGLGSRLAAQTRQARAPSLAEALTAAKIEVRSEEHTSEPQSQEELVCCLLLEKKKTKNILHV